MRDLAVMSSGGAPVRGGGAGVPEDADRWRLEVDAVDQEGWSRLMETFEDASLYQAWAYAVAGGGRREASHLVLRGEGTVLGCCQVILRRIPLLGCGVADIKWGPLFLKGDYREEVLAALVHHLKEEYGIRRRCLIRMWPRAIGARKPMLSDLLRREGFVEDFSERPYRTLMLDLAPSLEALRGNLLQKWRNGLNKAERNGLTVVEGNGEALFGVLESLAEDMRARKHLGVGVDCGFYRRLQRALPDSAKLHLLVCEQAGCPVAAAACSHLGDTGIYLLGATGQRGMGLNGSYLLQWRMIQWLKSRGARTYDLGAINPRLNPGVYEFKAGVAGKAGWDETFPRRHLGAFHWRSRLAGLALRVWPPYSGWRAPRFCNKLMPSGERMQGGKAEAQY